MKQYKAWELLPEEKVYLKSEVDAAIAELKEAWRSEHEACEALKAKLEDVQNIYKESLDVKLKIWDRSKQAEDELESIKASHYAEIVDAGMRERRLRRALYKACANWADVEVFERTVGIDDPNVEANRWALMRNKCLKKEEEYK